MEFKNTLKEFHNLGGSVVEQSKRNLIKEKKQTRSNTLYNDMTYHILRDDQNILLEWTFGGAEDYWNFVNEGVKGSGGFKGSGKMRGQGSPFNFTKKNIKRGVVLGWIRNKPIKLRDKKTGRFIEKNKSNLKTAAFLIGRAIAQRGLTRTLFFTKAFDKEIVKSKEKIGEAFAEDLETQLEKLLK